MDDYFDDILDLGVCGCCGNYCLIGDNDLHVVMEIYDPDPDTGLDQLSCRHIQEISVSEYNEIESETPDNDDEKGYLISTEKSQILLCEACWHDVETSLK